MAAVPFAERLSCTINEACQATGIGRTKLYEEMGAGRIQTAKVGRRRLVLVASLLRLIDPQAAGGWAKATQGPSFFHTATYTATCSCRGIRKPNIHGASKDFTCHST